VREMMLRGPDRVISERFGGRDLVERLCVQRLRRLVPPGRIAQVIPDAELHACAWPSTRTVVRNRLSEMLVTALCSHSFQAARHFSRDFITSMPRAIAPSSVNS